MAPEDITADPVGPLADEFTERCRRGERPSVSEYTERHPELADRIRQVFSMIMVMEQAGSQVGDGSNGDGSDAPDKDVIPERIGGYRILREIGQGGMGVVYEAEQTALGRHVALKVLPIGAARKRDRWERFQREARAAARLHHTNIVPVYEVGSVGDLCYYAMQFIHGQPLDVVLQELRSLYQDSRSPAVNPQPHEPLAERQAVARSLFVGQTVTQTQPASPDGAAANREFTVQSSAPPVDSQSSSFNLAASTIAPAGRSGRWHYYRNVASIGIQVAEALEYAHREGVIHRDIKPSNLLLDAAGRVWITDFGLAYQTEALAPGEKGLTQTGEIVGTIRYMPPERFRGWSDPRSDVYSLGLTLYEMLLFRPAFDAPDQVGLMHLVTQTQPVRPRKADSQIPRDLETIVLKAIDKEPARRYQSAAELAGDLKRFIEDRPILARHTGISERIWRWSRRHPSKVALAASVFGILLLVTAGVLWQAHQQQLHDQRVAQALDWAGQLRDQGRWSEARAAVETLVSAAEGNAELKRRVEIFLDELSLLDRLVEVRTSKGDHFDDVDTNAEYALAFRDHGIDMESLTVEEIAHRIGSRSKAVSHELVAALDDWALESKRQKPDAPEWRRLIAIAEALDPDEWRGGLRQMLVQNDLVVLRQLKSKADLATLSVQSLQLMGQALAATGNHEATVSWLRAAQQRHPGDVWINYLLARNLRQMVPPRLADAIAFYRAAVAVRPDVGHELAHALEQQGDRDEAITIFEDLCQRRPKNPRHFTCLGSALKERGKLTAALTAYDQAIALRPEEAKIYNDRGVVRSALGDLTGALADYERASKLQDDFAKAHYNQGRTLADFRRWDEALRAYDRAIKLRKDYFAAHHSRGVALAAKGQMREAVAAYDSALALNPDNAETHYNRANSLRTLRRWDDALKAYDEALALKPDYAVAHTNRGSVLTTLDRLDEAVAAYDKALHFQPNLAMAHLGRGEALHAKGQFSDAMAAFDRALVHNANLAEADFNRGRLLREKGQLSEAQVALTQAIRSKPGYAEAHCNLGAVLMMQGLFAEALVAYRKGHELGSKDPRWPYPSAQWVRTIEQLIEAEKKLSELRRGDYQPANATERLRFAQCCAYKGLHGAAARQFEEAFKARPELAENVSAGHRARAACSAAMAGCGKGKDAAELDELTRAYWRDRALTWLREDLRAWSKRLQGDKPQSAQVRRILWIWRQDIQLACVRDAAEIAKLAAAEQESFKKFWAEVSDTLQHADGRK